MEEIEVEVGEYVRTKNGVIAKVLSDDGLFLDIDKRYFNEQYQSIRKFITHEQIAKHSKNIIDLIEVGDIVEVFDVLHNDIIIVWHEEVLKALKEDIEIGIGIKSILTHEQYNSIKYEVE